MAPAEKTAAKPRTAASLQCSKDADAKGLHGKERKKFMSACKRAAADKANAMAGSDPEAKTRRAEMLLEIADTQQLAKQYTDAATTYEQLLNEKTLTNRAEELALPGRQFDAGLGRRPPGPAEGPKRRPRRGFAGRGRRPFQSPPMADR